MKARRETSPKKSTSRKSANRGADRKSARPAPTGEPDSSRVKVDAATRYNLIARAAYLRAEKRGFAPGGETQDWLEAEAEIERLLES